MSDELNEKLNLELEAGIEVRNSYDNVKTFEELKERAIRTEQILERLLHRFLALEEYFTDNEIIHIDEYEDRLKHIIKTNLKQTQQKKKDNNKK